MSGAWNMLSGCLALCCSCYTSSQTQVFRMRFCPGAFLSERRFLAPKAPHAPCALQEITLESSLNTFKEEKQV